jgi:hypothetical protein
LPDRSTQVPFYALAEGKRFEEALNHLKEPAFMPAEIVQERAKILVLWSAHANSVFELANFRKAADEYKQLVENYPKATNVDDFKLMHARSSLAFDSRRAGQVFARISAPDKTDSPRNQIYHLVKLLCGNNESKEGDRLDDLYSAWKRHAGLSSNAARNGIWTATSSEQKLLEGARTRIVANWLIAAETRPAKENLDGLTKIVEIDPTNVDALIAKADAHRELNQPEELAKTIRARIDYAEKVIAGGGGPNLQFAYEAAANAYEDLAWHARVEPEKSFAKAIEHLTDSVALNRNSPAAHMALARSYYNMIVEAGVNRKLSRENLAKARGELEEAIALAGDGKSAEPHLWLGKVIQATHVDEQTSLEAAQKLLTTDEYQEADRHFTKALLAAKSSKTSPEFLATYAYASAEHALFNPALRISQANSAIETINNRADELAKLQQGRTVRMDPEQEARIIRATADLLGSSDPTMPVKVLESLDSSAISVLKSPYEELTRSDAKLIEFRLGLQAKLRPDQLASPAIVRSAVADAIWYSTAPTTLAFKDRLQALTSALRLSQQLAIKNPAFIAAAANDQANILRQIIDVKRPVTYDFQRHLEIVKICITALKEANSPAMVNVHQVLRQVTRAYLQDVVEEAARLKRPPGETAALEKMLAAVPP